MYAIYREDTQLYCRWDEKVIVFDTTEEVEKFANEFPFFFSLAAKHVRVIKVTVDDDYDDSILTYKDISKDAIEENKQLFKEMEKHNDDMKEELKNE